MKLTEILKTMAIVARHATLLAELKKSGQPLVATIREHAPELNTAIKEIAAATYEDASSGDSPPPSPEAHEKAIAKAIFAPHAVAPAEQAWLDRASQSFGAG